MSFQRITMNLVGAQLREERLNGKDYLVVPTVMLTEGVHNGDQGPLYYPPDEMGKTPWVWNHRPIVLDHPSLNGQGISACSPEVIDKQGVGLLFNTDYDGRLKTESWLEKDKITKADPTIIPRLRCGETIEVSTGLFQTPEKTPGTWNGENYVAIARNYQPDHLAILTKQKGACSIADGAGLLRNAAATSELSHEDIREQIRACLRCEGSPCGGDYCYVSDVYPKYCVYEKGDKCYKIGYKIKSGKVSLDGEPEEVRKLTTYVTANNQVMIRNEDQQGPLRSLPKPAERDLSDVMVRQQMENALKERYSGIQQEGDWGGWITDLYANYVVWSKNGKHFRLPYTYDDDKVTFGIEPEEEVERLTEYRTKKTPIDGTQSPLQTTNKEPSVPNPVMNVIHQGAHHMIHDGGSVMAGAHQPSGSNHSDSQVRTTATERKGTIDHMVAKGGWGEEDRKFLESLPDDHWQKVSKNALQGATQPIIPYTAVSGDRSNAPSAPAHNAAVVNQMTDEQYLASLPPRMREMVTRNMAREAAYKSQLIQALTSNRANKFTAEFYATKEVPELEGLVAMFGGMQTPTGPTQNYGGQAEVPMFLPNIQPTQNADDGQDPVLPMPTINADTWGSSRVEKRRAAVS